MVLTSSSRYGSFYVPLMPAFAVFKIVVLYYVKLWSTDKFCLPPQRAFKARQNFRFLLNAINLLTLVLVMIPLGYTIVK